MKASENIKMLLGSYQKQEYSAPFHRIMTQAVDKVYKKKGIILPNRLEMLQHEGVVLPHKGAKSYRYTSHKQKDSPVKVISYSQYKAQMSDYSPVQSTQNMPYIKLLSSLHRRPRLPPKTQHSLPLQCKSHRIYELNAQKIKNIQESITTSKATQIPFESMKKNASKGSTEGFPIQDQNRRRKYQERQFKARETRMYRIIAKSHRYTEGQKEQFQPWDVKKEWCFED